MNLKDYTTEQIEDFFNAEKARKYSIINYHEKNKSLYLKVWNESIAPAIVNGKCYCICSLSYIGDSGQRQDVKDYFENLGYRVKCENANYVEIYW